MVKREILSEILPWLSEKKVILIKGARQVGKTTLLHQIREILEKEEKQVVYFSIDQELTNPVFSNPKNLIKFLKNEYDIENKNTFLLLDEFQYIKDSGLFLKVLFDISKEYLNIIISGSSALKLTEHKEFFTGRKVEFYLPTFSFLEYLWARTSFKYNFLWKLGDKFEMLKDFYQIYKNDLQSNFVDYINWGGYPEVVLHSQTEKRNIILKEIINTYIKKDVIDFLKIENISGFNNLIAILSSQIGNLVNKHELCNTLRLHSLTLGKYLNILEGTFIFSFISPFYRNIRKELSRMPKVYVNDFGIKKYFIGTQYNSYTLLDGNSVENYVYNSLKKKFDKESIYFYRTVSKSEVDFVIKEKQDFILMEIKFRNKIKLPYPVKRFNEQYGNVAYIVIITKDLLKKEGNVIYLPVVLLPFVSFSI